MRARCEPLVVGGGVAGAAAAIAAADRGLDVLLIEKADRLGGSALWPTGNLLELSGPSAVAGATIRTATGDEVVVARAGVVLATGGLEASEALKDASLPVPHLVVVGSPGNTGDGLLAAQQAGAALWHMSAFFGFWAFQPPTGGGLTDGPVCGALAAETAAAGRSVGADARVVTTRTLRSAATDPVPSPPRRTARGLTRTEQR